MAGRKHPARPDARDAGRKHPARPDARDWNSRRILVTGLSTYWGGRLAQALEAFPEVEAVIGVDNEEPKIELERTEYVKVGAQHALLRRVVEAAEIDTVVDTRLVVDSTTTTSAKAHENNIIGTMNILAACSGADSPVRKVVFKSSAHYYGCEQDDPAFFDETMGRPHPPRTPIERDIVEAEASLNEFAEKNPGVAVSILRFANVLGPDVRTSHVGLFSLPAVPMILGFDPRYQFVHEDDVVHALEHAVKQSVPGVYNVAGDGVLALSEVAGLLGKPYAPVLPFWGTGLAASALRRIGVTIPPETLQQLRFGRGLDNRRLKATGFRYGYTCREAVLKLGEHLRLDPLVRGGREPYRYEREVEDFLRWSPHVKNARDKSLGSLSRDELADLQRLLAGYAGEVDPTEPDQEERVRAAERAAEKAVQRAKKAEQRAAEAALKATERAEKAERRAGEAAEEAVQRMSAEAAQRATDDEERRARERAEDTELRARKAPPAASPVDHYDDLAAEEVIALLASLERDDLQTLRDYERRHANRARVLSAIESVLARRETPV
ncbi:MAG: NAD-dependent epimerase/dehydratase family protein [Thermoleophilaceae bacterium]|nr:NAD-dependent epimerase/dehydratase family protein [Thermoleophilaceae bacterium]